VVVAQRLDPAPTEGIANAFHGLRPAAKYNSGSVDRWYSRAPTRPAGTAHMTTSVTPPGRPPRAVHRRPAHTVPTTTPVRMARAYPRTGNGPTCHTPRGGLGIDSRSSSGTTLTGTCPTWRARAEQWTASGPEL